MYRICLALVCLAGCARPPPAAGLTKERSPLPAIDEGEFVRADGARFVIGERPVRFVGVNASLVHGGTTRADTPRLLESMAGDGVRLARVWALGETEGDEAWRRDVAFRLGPDVWVEESFEHLDRVLAEARANDVRVILVLANRWGDRGGLPQLARWAGITPRRRHLLPSELRAVLESEAARALYLAHVERLVTRRNTVTGVAYRDDPTIFAWELVNELSSPTCAAQRAQLDWVQTMSSRVRALDPNHLIAAGHIGYNSEQSLAFWKQIHRLPEIGYADTHGYPQNLVDAVDPDALGDWLDHRAASADALGLPLLVGEVGVPRGDDGPFAPRAAWFETFFDRASRDGTDGVLLWIYRPWQEHEDSHGIWPWGPLAEETAPVRRLLQARAKPWDRVEANGAPDSDWALGVERVVPFVEGDWEGDTLEVDPWALAEGCAESDSAWLLYALPWQARAGRLDVAIPGETHGALRVLLDGRVVGTWRQGRFTQSHPPPLGTVTWMRLEALDADGAALLRRFTTTLPGATRLALTLHTP